MSHLRLIPKNVHLIREAYDDFLLSREAALLSPRTIEFYERTTGDCVSWLEKNLIEESSSRDVRAYLTHCKNRGLSDSSVHGFARGVKAFLLFAHAEGYLAHEIKFRMPKVPIKPMPVLNSEEIKTLLKACITLRDKLVICFLVDTGARRAEAVSINWGDVDISSGR